MTSVATDRNPMSSEVQIRCAIGEGMENIFRAVFGQNMLCVTEYNVSKITVNGLGMAHARASAVTSSGRSLVIKADVSIRFPDAEDGEYRIDDSVFQVEANDWAKDCLFQACCEHNLCNGAIAIVRQVSIDLPERWLVAGSKRGDVLFRCPHEHLPRWVKEIVAEKWSHLPHVVSTPNGEQCSSSVVEEKA